MLRVLAHHLIWTGYGHWLPNDPRGSGSLGMRSDELSDLGPIHYGRKSVQPPREEVQEFHLRAEERLKYPRLLLDDPQIAVVGSSFGETNRDARLHVLWLCRAAGPCSFRHPRSPRRRGNDD